MEAGWNGQVDDKDGERSSFKVQAHVHQPSFCFCLYCFESRLSRLLRNWVALADGVHRDACTRCSREL